MSEFADAVQKMTDHVARSHGNLMQSVKQITSAKSLASQLQKDDDNQQVTFSQYLANLKEKLNTNIGIIKNSGANSATIQQLITRQDLGEDLTP